MWKRRFAPAAVAAALVVSMAAVLQLPWLTQWGSIEAERTGPMAGDHLVADAPVWTRSITIGAAPERVWPWLVQIGVDKGGFYTYDWAEQLAFDPVHNAIRIHPEWQRLEPGDEVHPFAVGPPWIAEIVEPNRTLVLSGDDGRWSWATELRPLPGQRTRVVTRFKPGNRSPISLVLDPADLIVFPRVLVGLKQRAEGTLPGMPGTATGRPFPIARLPVGGKPALAWLAGLAALAVLAAGLLGLGRWGRPRPHPWLTATVAFVAGAGYLIMSDTPPVQFFTHTWGAGLGLAVLLGIGLGRRIPAVAATAASPARRRSAGVVPRAVAAAAEAGLFVVLPATAVWQAATAAGWTTSVRAHLLVGAAATLAATATGTLAGDRDRPVRHRIAVPAVLGAGYAATGSGLVPLLGALVLEVVAHRRSITLHIGRGRAGRAAAEPGRSALRAGGPRLWSGGADGPSSGWAPIGHGGDRHDRPGGIRH